MVAEARPRRARRPADKQARRRDILDAALALLEERRFAAVKIADIAARAGLAKGTVFLYFRTKEELFLALLLELIDEWLTELDAVLERGRGRWSTVRVAQAICETLVPREALTRLLTTVTSVLEHNVTTESVAAFKRALLVRLRRTGELLERRLPFLAPDEGALLLLRVYAVVVGVRQLSDPGPAGREALREPDLAPLAIEYEAELYALLSALLRGLERARRPAHRE